MIVPINHRYIGTQQFIIDDEDFERINGISWSLNTHSNRRTFYVQNVIYNKGKYVKRIHLHRFLLGLGQYAEDKRIVNHINGNGLDNRRCNLEICNKTYNNQSINQPNRHFGLVDVDHSNNRKKKWRYRVCILGKQHQKRFYTKEEAQKGLCHMELLEKMKTKNLFPSVN